MAKHHRRRHRRRIAFHARRANPRRSYHSRRRRSYRRNPFTVHRRHHHRRHHYRRNPFTLAGLNLQEMLYAGGAVVVEPFIRRELASLAGTVLPAGATGRWIVKVGSSAITWQLATLLLGRRVGDITALVLGANLVSQAVSEFMPAITPGVSNYLAPSMAAYSDTYQRRGLGLIVPGAVAPFGRTMPAAAVVNPYDRLAPKF